MDDASTVEIQFAVGKTCSEIQREMSLIFNPKAEQRTTVVDTLCQGCYAVNGILYGDLLPGLVGWYLRLSAGARASKYGSLNG